MMGWWKRFREWDQKGLLIDRVEGEKAITKRGFIFDRRIFRVYMIVVFAMIFWIMATSSVPIHAFYANCSANGPACPNPCYKGGDRCGEYQFMETLQPGITIGTPPDQSYLSKINGLFLVIFFGFVVAFSVNKMIWNRGRSIETIFPELKIDQEEEQDENNK